MARVLLVDDEPSLCQILALVLQDHGHIVDVAHSGQTALEIAGRTPPELTVIDVGLPGMSGLETFQALRERDRTLPGIFITANGSIPSAVAAIRAGGYHYLTKPFDNEELLVTMSHALELRQLNHEVGQLKAEINARHEFPGIIGRSPAIQEVLRMLPRVAGSDATVLLLGESGTGKELIARNIHRYSARASGPFVAINSSAIPSGLVETEFFGHERGAFTDAKDRRIGRFEQAHKGTLFLDEIGDLPLDAQAKLLRVLEDKEVSRVGSTRTVEVDVRLIAATNRNLEEAMRHGRFREDLYWRINVFPIRLPPLRERMSDVLPLANFFIDRLNNELGRNITTLSDEVRERLLSHDWRGNVRELENFLRRSMIMAEGPVLQVSDLKCTVSRSPEELPALTLAETVSLATARLERTAIETALTQCRGNRTQTAAALGINRKTLFNKMRQFALTTDDRDDGGE